MIGPTVVYLNFLSLSTVDSGDIVFLLLRSLGFGPRLVSNLPEFLATAYRIGYRPALNKRRAAYGAGKRPQNGGELPA
jgi:hypothetical protein